MDELYTLRGRVKALQKLNANFPELNFTIYPTWGAEMALPEGFSFGKLYWDKQLLEKSA